MSATVKLSLTVVASGPGGAALGTVRSFERQDAVIGRGAQCDWILPDPANHLSKRHCVISFTGSGCVVTDTSTNGVFLNDDQALGNGNSAPVADGDRLCLGDYVLEARITAAAERTTNVPVDRDDPFGIADYRNDAAGTPRPAAEPFASLLPQSRTSESGEAHSLWPGQAANEWRGPAMPDDVAAERAAFVPPRVEGGAIPENWLDDGAVVSRPRRPPPPAAAEPLVEAFLSGAGLPGDAVAGQDPAQVMRALGRAYRETVLGLADILRTRGMIKAEFRIERTMIGASANNPLKFLSEPDAILAAMVGRPSPGFSEASAAIRDGIRDVKAHELAMLAAMQAALAKLIGQLDPATLTARLDRRSLLQAVVPAARKARYWELFEQSYRTIAAQLEEDFHGAFGEAFAAAYQDEMRRK